MEEPDIKFTDGTTNGLTNQLSFIKKHTETLLKVATSTPGIGDTKTYQKFTELHQGIRDIEKLLYDFDQILIDHIDQYDAAIFTDEKEEE